MVLRKTGRTILLISRLKNSEKQNRQECKRFLAGFVLVEKTTKRNSSAHPAASAEASGSASRTCRLTRKRFVRGVAHRNARRLGQHARTRHRCTGTVRLTVVAAGRSLGRTTCLWPGVAQQMVAVLTGGIPLAVFIPILPVPLSFASFLTQALPIGGVADTAQNIVDRWFRRRAGQSRDYGSQDKRTGASEKLSA